MMRSKVIQVVLGLGAALVLFAATAPIALGSDVQRIRVRDECDQATFDAAIGPGTCDPELGGNVTFERFVAALEKDPEKVLEKRKAVGWRFSPDDVKIDEDEPLLAVSRGGEFHTFTELAEFAPGCVPFLNNILFGSPDVNPVCSDALLAATGVPAGRSLLVSGLDEGTHFFQCMIHPWMRTEVVVEE